MFGPQADPGFGFGGKSSAAPQVPRVYGSGLWEGGDPCPLGEGSGRDQCPLTAPSRNIFSFFEFRNTYFGATLSHDDSNSHSFS